MKPFSSGRVEEYRPPPIRLDWSILPAELSNLRKPASSWGRLYADEQWYWVGNLLGRLQRRTFMAEHRTIEDRPEAVRVMNLQFLLDNLFPY